MARLHRERHEKGGIGGRGLEDGGPGDTGGGSSTGRQRRVDTLTPEIRETRKRETWLRSDGRVERGRGTDRDTDRQRDIAALYSRLLLCTL